MCSTAQSCLTLYDPVAHQAPLSMGFSRQEYWSGLPCPPPGELPNPGTEPTSPASPAVQVESLPTEPLGKPKDIIHHRSRISQLKTGISATILTKELMQSTAFLMDSFAYRIVQWNVTLHIESLQFFHWLLKTRISHPKFLPGMIFPNWLWLVWWKIFIVKALWLSFISYIPLCSFIYSGKMFFIGVPPHTGQNVHN